MKDEEIIKKYKEILQRRKEVVHEMFFNRDIVLYLGDNNKNSYRITEVIIDSETLNGHLNAVKHKNEQPDSLTIRFVPKPKEK